MTRTGAARHGTALHVSSKCVHTITHTSMNNTDKGIAYVTKVVTLS